MSKALDRLHVAMVRGGIDPHTGNAFPQRQEPRNNYPRVFLRCVDPGTDNECWVVCAKGDPGAVSFLREA